jgi:hypothetical protein
MPRKKIPILFETIEFSRTGLQTSRRFVPPDLAIARGKNWRVKVDGVNPNQCPLHGAVTGESRRSFAQGGLDRVGSHTHFVFIGDRAPLAASAL